MTKFSYLCIVKIKIEMMLPSEEKILPRALRKSPTRGRKINIEIETNQ